MTVTPYDIKDLLEQVKSRHRSSSSAVISPMAGPIRESPSHPQLLSGYLSVSVDQAHGFHSNCNVWVAIETDFYKQFTTQARTRIASTKVTDRRIGKFSRFNQGWAKGRVDPAGIAGSGLGPG